MQNKVRVLGLMSGTSLDGIDLALCEFWQENRNWKYQILNTKNKNYSKKWIHKLSKAQDLSVLDFLLLHNEYGHYLGQQAKLFIDSLNNKPQLIASHGHTIFHQTKNNFTFQLGNPAEIAAQTDIKTIADFRSLDVALGGQGAPLVPIGDKLLFPKFDICLNLGGFANLSLDFKENRIAYDICAINFVLNHLAKLLNQDFDKNGEIGRNGKINRPLLQELNKLDFYTLLAPKSLAREWVEGEVFPIFNRYKISINDMLRTYYEHISIILSQEINQFQAPKILITGGGAHNKYLIELLKKNIKSKVIIPDNQLINFKEALVFAFLGFLRFQNQNNCLASVTGASSDNSGGGIYG